jgi:hypothetical protein
VSADGVQVWVMEPIMDLINHRFNANASFVFDKQLRSVVW